MIQRVFGKYISGIAPLIMAAFVLCLAFVPVQAQGSREILRLGRGTANALDWRPDGKVLAVGSATGVWLLDETLNIMDHQEPIESVRGVKWSPDGLQIAITGTTGEMCLTQIWDTEFSHKQTDIDFCGDELKWSTDGTRLAILQENEANIALVDPTSGSQIATLIGQSGVWSPDSKTLITSAFFPWYGDDPSIYIWDSQTGEQQRQIPHDDTYGFGELLWSAESNKVAIWCNEEITENDNLININICELNVHTGKISTAIELTSTQIGDNVFITQPQWNDSHDYIAYVLTRQIRGFLDLINLFNQRSGELTYVGDGYVFAWKPDKNIVTSIVGNGFIQNINAISGEVLQEQMLFTAPINSIAWRPNGEQIASVGFGYEQDVRVWDVTQAAYEPELMWPTEPAEKVFYTPDNKELVTAGTIVTDIILNHDISAWDADTGERSRNIAGFYSQFDPFPLIAWNKDFTRSVRSDRDNTVQISENPTITTTGSQTFGIVWSPDDTQIATVSSTDNYQFTIETWDVTTGTLDTSFSFPSEVQMINWSPDGSKIVIRTDTDMPDTTLILDAKTGEILQMFFQSWSVAWSADSRFIAVEANSIHAIVFWDSITGKSIEVIGSPNAMAWSPDGSMLALGMNDGTIRIWDVSDLGSQ